MSFIKDAMSTFEITARNIDVFLEEDNSKEELIEFLKSIKEDMWEQYDYGKIELGWCE